MNMVGGWVVTFHVFNKENPWNFLALSGQQSWGQPTKVAPPKAKGAKPYLSGGSTSYSMEWGEKNKSWKCGGPHKKKRLFKSTAWHKLLTLILANHVPIVMYMGMMPIIASQFA